MEFWEFLIQQEGDRSWLPLESPSVEILEGRYRIVARSSRTSTPTEVRVTHYDMQADPPVQRARKRSSQTNPDGLIVILPFTRLEPGLWELSCTGDVMAEMMGQNWQYSVQLEVVPQEASIPGDWEPEWQLPATEPDVAIAIESAPPEQSAATVAETPDAVELPASKSGQPDLPQSEPAGMTCEASPAAEPEPVAEAVSVEAVHEAVSREAVTAEAAEPQPISEMQELLQQVEQVSQQLVDSAFSHLEEFDAIETPTDEAALLQPNSADRETVAGSSQLRVVLEQEVLILQRGESLSLTGRLDWVGELDAPQPVISELRVRLYDPQTSQILMDEVHPIDQRTPPFPFSGTVSLPEHYQTYLVLGELIFQGIDVNQTPQVLATHLFHVTTDLHELIESIANDFPDVEALPPEARLPDTAEPMRADDLSRLSQSTSFQRWSQQPLPPQLHPHTAIKTHAALNLPSFGSVSAPVQSVEQTVVPEVQLPHSEQTTEAGAISHSAADLLPQMPLSITSSEASDVPEPDSSPDASEAQNGSAEKEEAVQYVPAQSAKTSEDLFIEWDDIDKPVPIWQQRQRSLSRPVDTSNAPEDVSFRALKLQDRFWTRLQALAAHPAPELTAASSPEAAPPRGLAVGLDADLTTQEIVVDDEPPVQSAEPSVEPEPEPEYTGPILPEDEPIPTPRLQLANAEITAGQPVPLTVKLPTLDARVYIKLWLRDRQSRTLLGTPRWLIDFVPDGFGNQMARTEIIVPPGCLKVQFEAITVEIATQRESDKMTITRPVVPPDLSPLSLDELEI